MKTILTFLLFFFLVSCGTHQKHHAIYKTTDKKGYCYYDDGMWYIYYMNTNGSYYYYGSASNYTSYDQTTEVDWTPSSDNVSNFNDMPADAQTSLEGMTESTGESVGGTEGEAGNSDSGMSESSGESSGGSDSGSDGGSSDGGGGD